MIHSYLEKSLAALGIGASGYVVATMFDVWLQRGVMIATIVGVLVPAVLAIRAAMSGKK